MRENIKKNTMKSLLKFLLVAAVLIFAGLWVMTIAKSCNNPGGSAINDLTNKAGDAIADGTDAVKDGVDDFMSDDEDDEFDDADFDEDGDEIFDDEDEDEDMDDEDEADFDDEEDDFDDENVTKNSGSSSSDSGGNASSGGGSNSGSYLVVSGSYLTEANAVKEVKRLKKLGYNNAEVVEFDFSQYHSVCVKRTNSLSEARGVKNQLVNKHNVADAYVHKKRKSKRRG